MIKQSTLGIIALSLFIVCLTILSHFFIDTELALFVDNVIARRVSDFKSEIPDILLIVVCILVCAGWTTQFFIRGNDAYPRLAVFSRFMALSVPLAYIAKDPLKWIFGRINTRIWFLYHESTQYHWFQGGGDYTGFPSGHMAVFTALTAAFCRACPRYSLWSVCLLVLLAAALIITRYHFLSDILAGILLGIFAHMIVVRAGQMLSHP